MSHETKMGRPKQPESERQKKVERIIETAQLLFIEEGYQAVSMRKIAAKAGMGTMTLYKYFPNKNAILHHIWAEFFDELFAEIQLVIDNSLDLKNQVKAVCMTYLNYWIKHKNRFRIVFLNEDRASSEDEFFINHANIAEKMLSMGAPLIQELLVTIDPEEIMIFLESMICYVHGIALNVITINEFSWNDPEKYIDIYIDAVL